MTSEGERESNSDRMPALACAFSFRANEKSLKVGKIKELQRPGYGASRVMMGRGRMKACELRSGERSAGWKPALHGIEEDERTRANGEGPVFRHCLRVDLIWSFPDRA